MPSYSYSRTTTHRQGPDGKIVTTTSESGPGATNVQGNKFLKSKQGVCQRLKGHHDHGHPESVSTGGRSFKRGDKNFSEIKADLLRTGSLYQDPDFPACDESLFYSQRPPKPFEWKRPKDITGNPELYVGGASRFDVQQGELGDCWLLAAVASVANSKELLARIIPLDQSFRDGDYAGIFHFQFYQYGKWVDVVIDDLLPTYYGQLVFLHSSDNNEFWSALLEKAYAKLHGSYESLKGGNTCEAMEDFTGGVTEMFDLTQNNPNLFQIIMKAHERKSLMGCSMEADPRQVEAKLDNGLVKGHAYSVTNVSMVKIQTPNKTGEIPMVRVRNPWGNECEWKGAWSDQSSEWKYISEGQKKEMGLTFDHDGEFWMAFTDFCKNFTKLEICNLSPDSLTEGTGSRFRWEMSVFDGAWTKGCSAGGCRNFLETFWTNPQYFITLEDPDDDDDDNKCTCIVGLMQKHRRKQRKLGLDHLTIGFALYKIEAKQKDQPLEQEFFKYNQSAGRSAAFINLREVNNRFKMAPGTYVLVPSTFEPNQPGDFILRVFTEKPANAGEVDEDTSADTDVQPKGRKPVTEPDEEQEEKLKEFFSKISGQDLEIDATELQQILNFALKKDFDFEGFGLDVCRSMVAMMDADFSGKLGFEEFKELWSSVRWWKTVFKEFDHDKSGTLNGYELRKAMHNVGYRLSSRVFKALILRFGQKDGTIKFDDFIMCAVKLKSMIEKFHQLKDAGMVGFELNDFVETTMYA